MRAARATAALLAAMALLAGCSQVAAISPVGGTRLAEVRFATGDVLVAKGVDILSGPDCEQADDRTVTCTGETVDGDAITSESPASDETQLTVTVGGTTIYSGTVMDALTDALEPTP